MKSCWKSRDMKFFKWGYTTYDKFIQIPLSIGIVKENDDEIIYHSFNVGDVVRIIGEDSLAFSCLKGDHKQYVCREDLILC